MDEIFYKFCRFYHVQQDHAHNIKWRFEWKQYFNLAFFYREIHEIFRPRQLPTIRYIADSTQKTMSNTLMLFYIKYYTKSFCLELQYFGLFRQLKCLQPSNIQRFPQQYEGCCRAAVNTIERHKVFDKRTACFGIIKTELSMVLVVLLSLALALLWLCDIH